MNVNKLARELLEAGVEFILYLHSIGLTNKEIIDKLLAITASQNLELLTDDETCESFVEDNMDLLDSLDEKETEA